MPFEIDNSNSTKLVLVKTRIDEHTYQQIKAIAKIKGKTIAGVLRTAISEFIEKHNED